MRSADSGEAAATVLGHAARQRTFCLSACVRCRNRRARNDLFACRSGMMASTLPSQCHMPATAVSSTVTAAMVAFAALSGAARLAAQSPGEIRGTITLITADGTLLAAAGAQVTLRCPNGDIVKFGNG